ncbi:MAG: hypothetical protein E7A06_13255 [Clostridiales bacterium]|nr:hypothetical protein [Clostridiales bacterium]
MIKCNFIIDNINFVVEIPEVPKEFEYYYLQDRKIQVTEVRKVLFQYDVLCKTVD